jgi:hypothetical protein
MRHYIGPDELAVVRRFVDEWEDLNDDDHTILRTLVRRLYVDVAEQATPELRDVRRLAMQVYVHDDLNIDDDAEIIKTDSGYWVQSWTYVPKD